MKKLAVMPEINGKNWGGTSFQSQYSGVPDASWPPLKNGPKFSNLVEL